MRLGAPAHAPLVPRPRPSPPLALAPALAFSLAVGDALKSPHGIPDGVRHLVPAHLHRVPLAHLPTPLEPLTRLSHELRGPELWVKRDDCTGLAFGGNKVRKLEYLLGDALANGADVLLTEGGAQSNHCRQTAAAAARCGMRCTLVLSGDALPPQGNLLLDSLLGADIVPVGKPADRPAKLREVARSLEERGKRPYIIPTGGSNGVGAMGYANAFTEMVAQAASLGVRFDVIVHASGSGGTQGGLLLGAKLAGSDIRIMGITDGEPRASLERETLRVAHEGADLLEQKASVSAKDVIIHEAPGDRGYGVVTQEIVDALRLVARLEGIVLDPIYTGKAMAGLIDLVRRGELDPDERVLFLHTGGTPALFAHASAIANS